VLSRQTTFGCFVCLVLLSCVPNGLMVNVLIDNVAEKTPTKKKRGRPAKAKAGMSNIELLVYLIRLAHLQCESLLF